MLSSDTLLSPTRLTGLLGATTESLRTDDGLSGKDLADLALRLRGAATGDIQFETVPFTDIGARRNGELVVLLDEPALPAFFADMSSEPEPEPGSTPARSPLLDPSEVTVEVQNGSGTDRLASSTADELAALGFLVSAFGNADSPGVDQTVVRHGSESLEQAQTLAAGVPGAVLELDDTLGLDKVVLVLGSDFDGLAEPAPKPTAPAPRTEALRTAADRGCMSRAGFDGDHQTTEDQEWQHRGSTGVIPIWWRAVPL